MKQLDYYKELIALIEDKAPVSYFIKLYRSHFDEAPADDLIKDYEDKINEVVEEEYDSYSSYDM